MSDYWLLLRVSRADRRLGWVTGVMSSAPDNNNDNDNNNGGPVQINNPYGSPYKASVLLLFKKKCMILIIVEI